MSGIIGRARSKSGVIGNGKGIGFFAHGNSEGSVTYADNAVIIFASAPYNEGGCYSTSTGRFTAPVTGFYHFDFTFYAYGGSNTYQVWLTDSNSVDWGRHLTLITTDRMGTWSQIAYLTKGMYIFPKNVGGDRDLYVHSASHTRFCGHLIGEE